MAKLTALQVKSISDPGRHGDGDGLYLNVAPSGSKSWVQRIVIAGRRRDIGLGPFPTVSLAQARGMAASNRAAVADGRNPLAEKREAKAAAQQGAPSVPTFAQAALQVIELRRPTWSNPKHAAQWTATLRTYAFPVLGDMAVDSITAADALAVLEPIWTAKPETASRVRQRMETVLDWAVSHGYRLDNPAGRSLLKVLPAVKRLKQHHPSLPYEQVPAALDLVRPSNASLRTKLAFEFLVLTAARSGEVRQAEWCEVDWTKQSWDIPALRMKARRSHRVPLSTRSVAVLQAAWEISGPDGLIFPAGPGDRTVSDMTFTALLRRLDIPAVPHGFRSSFRNWVEECTETPWSVAESALAHNIGNATQAAYMTSDLFEQRRELMERWARFVAGNCG
jgi:integrase